MDSLWCRAYCATTCLGGDHVRASSRPSTKGDNSVKTPAWKRNARTRCESHVGGYDIAWMTTPRLHGETKFSSGVDEASRAGSATKAATLTRGNRARHTVRSGREKPNGTRLEDCLVGCLSRFQRCCPITLRKGRRACSPTRHALSIEKFPRRRRSCRFEFHGAKAGPISISDGRVSKAFWKALKYDQSGSVAMRSKTLQVFPGISLVFNMRGVAAGAPPSSVVVQNTRGRELATTYRKLADRPCRQQTL